MRHLIVILLFLSVSIYAFVGLDNTPRNGSNRVPIITSEHLKIHQGDHFELSDYNADVDAAYYWLIDTPPDRDWETLNRF